MLQSVFDSEDEGAQLDEEDSEVSPADCVAEQYRVNLSRRTKEDQLRKDAKAQDAKDVPININISDIQGPLRSILAERRWLVADVKKVLERTEKIHRGRQRLLLGDGDVDDLQSLADLASAGQLNLVLVVCMDACLYLDHRLLTFSSFCIRLFPKRVRMLPGSANI